MALHNDLGKLGEYLALDFLKSKGYEIIQTTYRFKKAEIDIIARLNDIVIFVEVKTRSTNFILPEKAVNVKKQNLLMTAANQYIFENKLNGSIRFDIISIVIQKETQEIFHIEDAFFGFIV
jgi:putative endonuclease